MFLRVCHPDLSLRDGIKTHGWRAAMLGLVLVFPVTHFVCYRLTMHTNRYDLVWDPRQPLRMLNALLGGIGKDFLGPAIIAGLLVVAWGWFRGREQSWSVSAFASRIQFRAVFGAGLILFVLGWGVYAPMDGVAGRYTFPGVWGLDLWCALLWARVAELPSPGQKLAYVLLGCGLAVSAASNYGKQEKNTARITTLWDALEYVERKLPAGSRIAWVGVADREKSEALEISEGVHFRWHLEGRGRRDLQWQTVSPGMPLSSAEEPEFLVTSATVPPAEGHWVLVRECRHDYWFGRKQVVCCIWQRQAPP
jgi:hypothetical protein